MRLGSSVYIKLLASIEQRRGKYMVHCLTSANGVSLGATWSLGVKRDVKRDILGSIVERRESIRIIIHEPIHLSQTHMLATIFHSHYRHEPFARYRISPSNLGTYNTPT